MLDAPDRMVGQWGRVRWFGEIRSRSKARGVTTAAAGGEKGGKRGSERGRRIAEQGARVSSRLEYASDDKWYRKRRGLLSSRRDEYKQMSGDGRLGARAPSGALPSASADPFSNYLI